MRLRNSFRASGSPRTPSSALAARSSAWLGSGPATVFTGRAGVASRKVAAMMACMILMGQVIARRAAPPFRHATGRLTLSHDLALLEAKRDLALGRRGAVGAVHRVLLQTDGEILADRAGRRLGGIGRSHRFAISGDSVLAFEHLQDDGAGGHETDEVSEERLLLVDVIEFSRILLFPPHALLRDHPQARALEPRDDLPGKIALGRLGLDDRKRALTGHARLSLSSLRICGI